MNWELFITATLAVIGGLTVIGWLAHFVLRRGTILKPTITLHLIVKNCAPEVEGALRSLLLFSRPFQRWTLGRIKITDCASTDETAAIVQRLAAQNPIIELNDGTGTSTSDDPSAGDLPAGIELSVKAGDIYGWDLRSACDAICTLLE